METITVAELAERAKMDTATVRGILQVQWTTSLLAAAANVDSSWIRKLCLNGQLSALNPGGAWVIKRTSGDAWLADRGIHVIGIEDEETDDQPAV